VNLVDSTALREEGDDGIQSCNNKCSDGEIGGGQKMQKMHVLSTSWFWMSFTVSFTVKHERTTKLKQECLDLQVNKERVTQ